MVVRHGGPVLLSRNWLAALKLNWNEVCSINAIWNFDPVKEFDQLVQPKLKTYTGGPVHVEVDTSDSLQFFKARSVPFAYTEMVDAEIECLVKNGIY